MSNPLAACRAISLCLVVGTGGCATDPAFWGGVAAGAAGAASASTRLLVFGGSNNRVFLGCLSCSEFDSDSIFNQYGTYGSAYSATSILNSYSEYGSRYSAYSACNPYASSPPIVVDDDGNAYGRLTLNRYGRQIQDSTIVGWLSAVCTD